MSDLATLVVFVAGDREFHRPDETLGCTGTLDEQVKRAYDLEISDLPSPPSEGLAVATPGHVQLLRLDRVAQALEDWQVPAPVGFVFVLTDQADPLYRGRDTAQLAPVLARWCRARGFAFTHEVIQEPPHRLDGGGEELITKLDERLGQVEQVVLVVGGGPAALQTAAHFAAFQGVRHRDGVTVVQLEQIDPDTPQGPGRSCLPADTRVRPIRRFHRLVGQRTIDQQAVQLLDDLDLPGAAQLIRATEAVTPDRGTVGKLADELLTGLARQQPAETAMEQLVAAVDLAEVEWSRPGGSRAEALWYASMSVVDLLARAWADHHGNGPWPTAFRDLADTYNDALPTARRDAPWPQLSVAPRVFPEVAPILAAGPAKLQLPRRGVNLARILGKHHTGTKPDHTRTWAALLVTYKAVRNDFAHELVGLSRKDADDRIAALSTTFMDAVRTLSGDPGERVPEQEHARLEAVRDHLQTDVPSAASRRRSGRQRLIDQLIEGSTEDVTDEQLYSLLRSPLPPERFASLPPSTASEIRERLLGLLERLLGPTRTAAASDFDGLGPLDLQVAVERPASRFRATLQDLLPLPDANRLIATGSQLRDELHG